MISPDNHHRNLASFLREKGIKTENHERILSQIQFEKKKECVEICFPHKYLFELYKEELIDVLEQIIDDSIKYIIKEKGSITTHYSNHFNKNINEYTFNKFISGSNNSSTIEICKEIPQNNAKYNPIIIYGESSSGKTHIVNSIISNTNHDKSKIIDIFEIINTISNNNIIINFKNIINNDFLVIENINQITNDIHINQYMEKIIDHFYENKKQLVFTYKGKTIGYSNFSKSLRERIYSCLTLKINNPDLYVRIKFAKRFCTDNKIKISSNDIFTICSNCDTIRAVKGVLLKLSILSEKSTPISTSQVNRLFRHHKKTVHVDFNTIIDVVSSSTGVSASDLLTMKRSKHISLARQMCMYLCKSMLNWSYPDIGIKFDGRNHSTIIYSIKKIEKLRQDNKEIDIMLSDMFQRIENQSFLHK